MEYIIIVIICVILMLILKLVLDINLKKVKKIANNEELNNMTKNYPENMEIAKSILEKLGNNNVKVEENNDTKTSLYIVATNKITVANIRNSFTRIQTIAHECIHSVQPKNQTITNFIYSNIYLLYFIIIIIATILKWIPNPILHVEILTILSFIYYFIRSYLEIEAMTKAKYVAKEYLEENEIGTKAERTKLVQAYEELNSAGIKCANYSLLLGCMIRIVLYCVVSFIMTL